MIRIGLSMLDPDDHRALQLPTKRKLSLLLGRLLLPCSSYVVSTRTYYWPLVMLDPDDHRALLPTKPLSYPSIRDEHSYLSADAP